MMAINKILLSLPRAEHWCMCICVCVCVRACVRASVRPCVWHMCVLVCVFVHENTEQVDIGSGVREAGYYVQRRGGLFPAPYPQDFDGIDRVVRFFHFLGTFLAKCLQDGRLVDIPLSNAFLKVS